VDPRFWNGEAQVERRRREYRGAAGVEGRGEGGGLWALRGMGFERGCPPPHWGWGMGHGAVPPPQNFFNNLAQNSAFWRLF